MYVCSKRLPGCFSDDGVGVAVSEEESIRPFPDTEEQEIPSMCNSLCALHLMSPMFTTDGERGESKITFLSYRWIT